MALVVSIQTRSIVLPGEAGKALTFPTRHRLAWPSQIAITHVICFVCVVRHCFHHQETELWQNLGSFRVPALTPQEHPWYWFFSVSDLPPPAPFGVSPPSPGDSLHRRVSGGPITPSPETQCLEERTSWGVGGYFVWLWIRDNINLACCYLTGIRFIPSWGLRLERVHMCNIQAWHQPTLKQSCQSVFITLLLAGAVGTMCLENWVGHFPAWQ